MFPEGILLQTEIYDALLNSIQRDCRVLESFRIMDYSLLIGVHNLDVAARTASAGGGGGGGGGSDQDSALGEPTVSEVGGGSGLDRQGSKVKQELNSSETSCDKIDR
jgi:hypothetical protein